MAISIHAPAWGATLGVAEGYQLAIISIHAPAWGATGRLRQSQHESSISIHAPAWGATRGVTIRYGKNLFQFTPPRGGRLATWCPSGSYSHNFNSRPRVGGDRLPSLSAQ